MHRTIKVFLYHSYESHIDGFNGGFVDGLMVGFVCMWTVFIDGFMVGFSDGFLNGLDFML